jgi:hypothetical protein
VVPVGNALRAGIEAACGRLFIVGDSDDSYDFTELDSFVEKFHDGYQLVMGNGIRPGAMPLLHCDISAIPSFRRSVMTRQTAGNSPSAIRRASREASFASGSTQTHSRTQCLHKNGTWPPMPAPTSRTVSPI